MAYEEGTTNYFANQAGGDKGILQCLLDFVCPPGAEYEENIGAGDDVEVTFAIALAHLPVLFETCEIAYVIGATPYTATLQDDDTFAGTSVASGSLDRATGVGSITFSTAPDDETDIDATYWAGKTQHEQTIGTGDDIETVFSTMLVNLPVAVGQCRVRYKIALMDYEVWLNGDDEFVGASIASGTLNRATGALAITFDDPITDTYEIKALYSSGEEGQDWLILMQQMTRTNVGAEAYAGTLLQEVVIRNSGVNGDDSVIVGVREWYATSSSAWSWNLNGYMKMEVSDTLWGWNLAIAGRSTYASGCFSDVPSMYFKDADPNFYKFSSNKRRITGVVRTAATLDMPFYLGFMKRIAKPNEYKFPLLVVGNYAGVVAYNSTSLAIFYSIIGINSNSAYISSANIGKPYFRATDVAAFKVNPGAMTLPMYPLYFFDNTQSSPNKDIIGELDGLMLVPVSGLISGDIVEESGKEYYIFQNVYRTTYYNYYAMLKETV